jgi:hypothetical protein
MTDETSEQAGNRKMTLEQRIDEDRELRRREADSVLAHRKVFEEQNAEGLRLAAEDAARRARADEVYRSEVESVALHRRAMEEDAVARREQCRADARLIAAAPEMLALLEAIAASDDPEADGLLSRCERLVAQIAKAKGEP